MGKTFCTGILCLLLSGFRASGEIVCVLGSGAASYVPKGDQRPTADAMQLAGRMNAALAQDCTPKCPQIAIFRNATTPNAMLVVTADQAKVVYAPQFFATIYEKYGDGAIIAVIAHEYGHALDEVYPASWMKKSWTPELHADAWAGCALARTDLSLNDLAKALAAVSRYPPLGGPNWALRLPALRLGYIHCGGKTSKFDNAAK